MRIIRKATGFTLIELLIVVAIIAILAAIAVPNFLETNGTVSRGQVYRVGGSKPAGRPYDYFFQGGK